MTKHISVIFKKNYIIRNIYSITVQSDLNSKHVSTESILRKVINSKTISTKLNLLLKRQSLYFKCKISKSINKYIENENELYELLIMIMYTGLEWYIYTNIKNKNLYTDLYFVSEGEKLFFVSNFSIVNKILEYIAKFLSLININLKNMRCIVYKYTNSLIYFRDIDLKINNRIHYTFHPSKKSIKDILYMVRNKLYHKNKQGHWRTNNYINSANAVLYINQILHLWYSYYSDILNIKEIFKINQITDKILYMWQINK